MSRPSRLPSPQDSGQRCAGNTLHAAGQGTFCGGNLISAVARGVVHAAVCVMIGIRQHVLSCEMLSAVCRILLNPLYIVEHAVCCGVYFTLCCGVWHAVGLLCGVCCMLVCCRCCVVLVVKSGAGEVVGSLVMQEG